MSEVGGDTGRGGPPHAAAAIAQRALRVEANVLREIVGASTRDGVVSLAGGMPASDLFDLAGIRAAASEVMEGGAGAREALQYGTSEGSEALRHRIAAVMAERGVANVEEDSIVVTTGASQGIDLVGRVLLDPGDTIAVERPTFLAALSMAQLCGARVVEVKMDSEGMDPDAFEAILLRKGQEVKALYTMPTFSNPSGSVLSLDRRHRLLELAREHGVIVIEDDPYGLLWFEREPPPCLLALKEQLDDPPAFVYLSSFSKIIAPGLRIGWMIAAAPVVERLTVIKQIADAQSSSLDQAIVTKYLESGRLAAHVERARKAYADRSRWLAEAIHSHLPQGMLEFSPPEGGMFLWCRLRHHSAREFAERALDHRVAVVPGDPFFDRPPREQYLRLSYSKVDQASAPKAIARLAAAAKSV